MKSELQQPFEGLHEFKVLRRYRDARGDLHPPLTAQEGPGARDDRVESRRAVLERSQAIMGVLQSVNADRDRKPMLFEEIRILIGQQRSEIGRASCRERV